MSKTLIISCSGNFYGSEQVLFDYLYSTKNKYDVYVPNKSVLKDKIQREVRNHELKTFNSHKIELLYFHLFWELLIGKYKTVYLNEAGHSKYILVLARIFKNISFVIHVRLMEDCNSSRWPQKPTSNISIISISNFIRNIFPFKSIFIYDPYPFSINDKLPDKLLKNKLIVGIIGRITVTKGVGKLLEILKEIKNHQLTDQIEFHFYGQISEGKAENDLCDALQKYTNVQLKGFQKKNSIYSSIDCVLHLSMVEPLGRIYFETIDSLKPFIGFNAAGIGEIGHLINQSDLLIDPLNENWSCAFVEKLVYVHQNYYTVTRSIIKSKHMAEAIFNLDDYTNTLDKLLA